MCVSPYKKFYYFLILFQLMTMVNFTVKFQIKMFIAEKLLVVELLQLHFRKMWGDKVHSLMALKF